MQKGENRDAHFSFKQNQNPRAPYSEEMSQEETLKSLFTAIKVSLKNASFYHKEHPAFAKSVEDLKGKLDSFMAGADSVKIGFTPYSIFYQNKHWEEDKIYRDLARAFHFRKVKSLEIKRGLTLQELTAFISNIHLPPKDIFKQGGLLKILEGENVFHLSLEELDYSQLLKGEGEEVKDVWTYLLDEAMAKEDQERLDQVAESFERIAGQLTPDDFTESEELPVNLSKLLGYMKKAQEERFHACAKILLKAFTKNKKLAQASKFEKLRILFSEIGEEDFASTLWEEIVTDSDFDALSFSIFSKLTERDKQEQIASKLNEEARKDEKLITSADLRKKIKALLSGTSSPFVSEIYRETLSSLLQDVSFQEELLLSRDQISRNYRFLLLNLFEEVSNKESKRTFLTKILEEWEEIIKTGDFEFLKHLSVALRDKDKEFASDTLAVKTNKLIADHVEKAILMGRTSPYLDYFLTTLEHSTLGVNSYLQGIFTDQRISPSILQFFFKYFSDSMLYFFVNLEQKASDSKFLDRMTESLKTIDSPLSLNALKTIYGLGSSYVKTKVLRAMQHLSVSDKDFLMEILKKGSYPLKKEALMNLVRNEATRDEALEFLFSIPSPFGIKNRVLRRHIKIVEETNLVEARDHILALNEKKDIWNKKLRKEAKKALEKLDARKN